MDDLNIHRYSDRAYDCSHNGVVSMKAAPDVEPGDFIVTETFCGVVTQVDSFDSTGYNGLLRIYVGGTGGVIRSPFDRVQTIV